MRLLSPSIFTVIGAAILLLTLNVEASTFSNLIRASANFNHLNPLQATPQMHQRGDIQPVSYRGGSSPPRRFLLYPKHRFNRHQRNKQHNKRDYATTLKLLKAALEAYKKDFVTPPPVSMMELPPPPEPAAIPANPIIVPAPQSLPLPPPMAQPPVAAVAPEVTPPASLIDPNPSVPDLTQEGEQIPQQQPLEESTKKDDTTAEMLPTPELGNEMTESTKPPKRPDIEEDDSYDPEEDPDDVDDPPVVNGIVMNREE